MIHLKYGKQRLNERIEIGSRLLLFDVYAVKFSAEYLHTQKSKYDNKQKQQEQKGGDWTKRIKQRSH